MGTRYFLGVRCASCGHFDDDVYYAPTCGFRKTKCPECGYVTDLAAYTGITEEMASNRAEIEALCKTFEEN